MRISDWSSDVCSSDLRKAAGKIGETEILVRFVEPARHQLDEVEHALLTVARGVARRSRAGILSVTRPVLRGPAPDVARSAERRVGTECVSPCRSRWPPDP